MDRTLQQSCYNVCYRKSRRENKLSVASIIALLLVTTISARLYLVDIAGAVHQALPAKQPACPGDIIDYIILTERTCTILTLYNAT